MVKAGVYLVARFTPIFGGTTLWTIALVAAGTLTMVGAAWRAVLETDLKRVLAYSTVSALGVLMLLLGVGSRAAVIAAVAYTLAHACYKGALFLVAGAVDHEAGTRDLAVLGGLGRSMRRTAVAALLAAGSMVSLPLTLGFIAKEQFYEALAGAQIMGVPYGALLVAAVIASALLGAAGLMAGVSPFAGRPRGPEPAHDAPPGLWLPPLVLAAAGLIAGVIPALAAPLVMLAAAAATGDPAPVSLAIWHGFTPTLALSAVTIAGSLIVYARRDLVRQIAWPRALRTERLYTGAIAALDAVSRAAAPALQSASLRSYVLTILITTVTLVGTAFVTARILPAPSRWTPIALHEGLIAVLILAGALSATVARSNMAAVLSVGSVGYGVSLMYAFFGAPDLAMTQFAVETLTVVIFVLVFYQLRGFGDLSSPLIKLRDGLVAAAAGTVIAALVLFIGASGTTSRLASYFADAAPRLAHGDNIVNVMLVDFRAFDTLGEITVLVTVAVGVRALLDIGRERRS
jgi:multicomponent Na+:H+ antiporter subunit A